MSLESLCCHPVVVVDVCVAIYFGLHVSVRVSTMFKFSKIYIVFSSLEPKAQCKLLWSLAVCCLIVVRPSTPLQDFSSDTPGPILAHLSYAQDDLM